MTAAAVLTLGSTTLVELCSALECGSVAAPYSALSIRLYAGPGERDSLAASLQRFADSGMGPGHIATTLRLVVAEREAAKRSRGRVELVWTGPEVPGAQSRDTAVVVDELFARARRSIVLASYSLWEGKTLFRKLSERMDADPDLGARMFFNIPRAPFQRDLPDEQVVSHFARRFREHHWAGRRFPEVFYDPRSLSFEVETKGVLHAKCIIVDDELALVTSANFSEAAHSRNIEAGVLVDNAPFARSLRRQFETLAATQVLLRVPGIG